MNASDNVREDVQVAADKIRAWLCELVRFGKASPQEDVQVLAWSGLYELLHFINLMKPVGSRGRLIGCARLYRTGFPDL